jgi:hypothetical protein
VLSLRFLMVISVSERRVRYTSAMSIRLRNIRFVRQVVAVESITNGELDVVLDVDSIDLGEE